MQGQLPPEAREKLEELSTLQQRAQQVAIQKQQAEGQLSDARNAIEALDEVDEEAAMYRQVGDLLVQTDYDEAREDLDERIDNLEVRVKTLDKQTDRVEKQFEQLQEELQELLGGLGGAGGMAGPRGPGGPGGPGA